MSSAFAVDPCAERPVLLGRVVSPLGLARVRHDKRTTRCSFPDEFPVEWLQLSLRLHPALPRSFGGTITHKTSLVNPRRWLFSQKFSSPTGRRHPNTLSCGVDHSHPMMHHSAPCVKPCPLRIWGNHHGRRARDLSHAIRRPFAVAHGGHVQAPGPGQASPAAPWKSPSRS